ncbi:hypothetical protein [Aerococcus sp. 1KP-2016]|uniref:hypothetical protein n=1 Tax=Aerococcus sp. 1KP-2016 TaxID=1981982 RepID=UPI000B9907DF|nr:hypothetical protein [Aerococcus sp. 1KP-2016]OYQ68285.1 hypothetical protein B9P78_00305 [Aerococcus sp. 1KP-2016]
MKYFKTIENSDFHKALKKNEQQNKDWDTMIDFVSEILGEPELKDIYMSPKLRVDVSLLKDENKKLFKQNGEVKLSNKAGKVLNAAYEGKLKELGLDDYMDIRTILFAYGFLRNSRSQKQNQFQNDDWIVYFESNAPWTEREYANQLEEITEEEFYEARLSLAKED